MKSCSQMDGCLLFEDKTLVTVMTIQGVTTEVTVDISASLCLRAAQKGNAKPQDIRPNNDECPSCCELF
jgi:hypothetical protein